MFGEIIFALQRHFMSGCVLLPVLQYTNMSSDLLLWRSVLQVQVLLSERDISTAAVEVKSLEQTMAYCSNTAFNIILCQDNIISHLPQVFSTLHPSDARWLLFTDNSSRSVEEILGDLHIPVDCEFLVAMESEEAVIFTEVYRVHPSRPLVASYWGTWSVKDGLQPPAVGFPARRSDLQGITLIVAAIHGPPRQTVKKDSQGNITAFGLFASLFQEIAKNLNFRIQIHLAENNAYGIQAADGSWNGAVGMAINRTIDTCMMPLTITAARSTVVDFTVPVHQDWVSMHIERVTQPKGSWVIYFSPFSSNLWLFTACWILFTNCALSAAHLFLPDHHRHSITDAILWTWGIFCAQGIASSPRYISGRAVLWLARISAVMLLAAYNANFTSHLTSRSAVLPFTDLQGFLKDGTYEFGFVANGSTIDVFKNGDAVMRRVYRKHIFPNLGKLPFNDLVGFRRMCNEKYVFMTFRLSAKDAPCDVTMIPANSVLETTAFILPKRSPYKRIINYTIQRMMRNGMYKRMYIKWMELQKFTPTSPLRSVEVNDVIFLLLIYVGGLILAIVIFITEISATRVPLRHCQ